MSGQLHFSCDCGRCAGYLDAAAGRSGTRLVCYCADCRAALRHAGRGDQLTADGGVDLFQTVPDCLTFTQGTDQLALMRLGPRGLFRWHAGCCGAPVANTLPKPTLPFVGLHVARFADPGALGPARSHVNGKGAWPRPVRDRGAFRLVAGVVWRAGRTWLAGRGSQTPFFTAAGAPIVTPQVLTLEERRAAARNR